MLRRLIIMASILLIQHPTATAQQPISILTSVATSISYTGLNTYVLLGAAYKKHIVYIGPKAVVSKSYVPGQILWGGNAGYMFSVIDQERWSTALNIDYQTTMFRNPATIHYNSIQEITGGLSLNYFPVPKRLSIGLTLGAGIFHENYYSRYSGTKGNNSGMMQQVRLGLTYKISRQ